MLIVNGFILCSSFFHTFHVQSATKSCQYYLLFFLYLSSLFFILLPYVKQRNYHNDIMGKYVKKKNRCNWKKEEPNNTSKKSSFEMKNSMDIINIRVNIHKRESFHFKICTKFLHIFISKHAKGSIQHYLK